MSNQNLIIYKYNSLYHILEELDLELSFKIFRIESENLLKDKIKSLGNYLIITDKNISNVNNQFILYEVPINISKFVEKINIEFLKLQYNNQSQIKIKDYIIDINSRQILLHNTKLKLTEKEINTIIYLSKSNKPVSINKLQEKVWSYQPNIETHTVETHIYRLRKKFLNTFNDKEFVISKKNGYQIK